VEREDHYWQIAANDQARVAADYAPLVLRWKDGNAIRLSDVAEVTDSVQDVRNFGVANGKPAILLQVFKQPGANIWRRWTGCAPCCRNCRPSRPAIDIEIVSDRTPTMRASVKEVERALVIAVALVILVVFLFLRNGRATLIPAWPCRCRWRARSA
jgi:multidrug efflux pump